jgi:hypothetical protein
MVTILLNRNTTHHPLLLGVITSLLQHIHHIKDNPLTQFPLMVCHPINTTLPTTSSLHLSNIHNIHNIHNLKANTITCN